ncbi:MAG: carbohydrate ABC transporter permease [Caldicoprobacterales bacterium]|jgi:putative aldouronate transport system permease protein|nr:carbohydrate ABC transporter permease [Clostridiales bacterium]
MQKKGARIEAFDVVNAIIMFLVAFITLVPFWFTLVGSFNEGVDYLRGGVYFWPRTFTLGNYRAVFVNNIIIKAAGVTALRTVLGTATHILFTLMAAYAMSRPNLKFRNFYMIIFVITMFFGGGLVPTYLLYRQLGLLNNFLVYIIPGLFNVWNFIIFRSFVQTIPEAMLESARIDGASEYVIFTRFILPLSKAAIATIALFSGVGHWNSWFDSMMYTTDNDLQTLQLFLMRIISSYNVAAGIGQSAAKEIPSQSIKIQPETLRLAMMIVTTAPIAILYPFLQKYFIKGVFIGSIKG